MRARGGRGQASHLSGPSVLFDRRAAENELTGQIDERKPQPGRGCGEDTIDKDR